MKTTDLRLGNYIDKYGKPIKVDFGILQKIENGSVIYKPIPLTEEYLLKFGFMVLEDEGDVKHYCKYKYDITWHDGNDFYFGIRDLNGSIYSLIQIFTVHQLQNLFYAIVGDELTLTE